jgi:hypothetical protein
MVMKRNIGYKTDYSALHANSLLNRNEENSTNCCLSYIVIANGSYENSHIANN